MKKKIAYSSVLLITLLLILPSALAAAQFTLTDIFLSKQDCTTPPTMPNPVCNHKTASFNVGERVYHCIAVKNTGNSGDAITLKFNVDGSLKKTNSVPSYPGFTEFRCDYLTTYSQSGTHIFKGEISPSSGTRSLSTSFKIDCPLNKKSKSLCWGWRR